jgi:post-segregation antitoxin (ccd killing protein)
VVERDRTKVKSDKVRATLYVPAALLEEARDAAVFLAGYPARMTLTKLTEDALRAELRRLKEAYNDGRDFPPRTEDLKGGRPIAA